MEVDAHQVTGPAVVDYTINKPQSGRAASHKLQRQGAVIDINLLASVASTHAHAPNEVISQQMYVLIFNCLIPDAATNWVNFVLAEPHLECSQYPSGRSLGPCPLLGQGCPKWADAMIQQNTSCPNFHPFLDKRSYYRCQLQYKPSIPGTLLRYQVGSVIFNIFNQRKTHALTHYVDGEELEDQPAFPVKVVGHDNLKVYLLMQIDCYILYRF